MSCTNSEYHL